MPSTARCSCTPTSRSRRRLSFVTSSRSVNRRIVERPEGRYQRQHRRNPAGEVILAEFHVEANGIDNHVANVATYGPIASGPLSNLTNSRISTRIAKNGARSRCRCGWRRAGQGHGPRLCGLQWRGVPGPERTAPRPGQHAVPPELPRPGLIDRSAFEARTAPVRHDRGRVVSVRWRIEQSSTSSVLHVRATHQGLLCSRNASVTPGSPDLFMTAPRRAQQP